MRESVLDIMICKYCLGLARPEEVHDAVSVALARGSKLQSLTTIHALDRSDETLLVSMLDRCLAEGGINKPSKVEAIRVVARDVARKILAGTKSAQDRGKCMPRKVQNRDSPMPSTAER